MNDYSRCFHYGKKRTYTIRAGWHDDGDCEETISAACYRLGLGMEQPGGLRRFQFADTRPGTYVPVDRTGRRPQRTRQRQGARTADVLAGHIAGRLVCAELLRDVQVVWVQGVLSPAVRPTVDEDTHLCREERVQKCVAGASVRIVYDEAGQRPHHHSSSRVADSRTQRQNSDVFYSSVE